MLPVSCAAPISTLPCIIADPSARKFLHRFCVGSGASSICNCRSRHFERTAFIHRQRHGHFAPYNIRVDTFRDFMTAELQGSEPATAAIKAQSQINSAEPAMIAEHAEGMPLTPCDPNGRRLRNRLLAANALAWIIILI